MSQTFSQIHIQCVFATKYRKAVIDSSWKDRLHRYIIGIINNDGHRVLAINSMPDHLHVFFGYRIEKSIPRLMQMVKGDSSRWINLEKLVPGHHFRWQEGFGAFSYCKDEVDTVVKYILNQEEHHGKQSFIDEYRMMLRKFGIDFDERYIFKEPE